MANATASAPSNWIALLKETEFYQSAHKIWSGRSRFFRAVKMVWEIDNSYRQAAQLVEGLERSAKDAFYRNLHRLNAEKLAKLCKANGATWVKMAQFLSSRPDLLPLEYIEALKPLQNDNFSVAFSQIAEVLDQEWPSNWRDAFEWVDEQPAATASIAQVHKARLKEMEGQEATDIAIKVQLPQVDALYEQDFIMFRLLAKALNQRIKQVDVEQVVKLLIEATIQELDFRFELSHIKEFGDLPHPEQIHVPTVLEPYCTPSVLVTKWIEGERLTDFLARASFDEKKSLLGTLSNSYMHQITRFGLFQADPHPGNFMVDDQQDIWILDYGTVGRLTQEEIQSYMVLFYALMNQQTDNLAILLRNAGFDGIDQSTINRVAVYLEGKEDLEDLDLDELVNQLIDRLRELQVVIPDNFVLLGRVLATLGGIMHEHHVGFRWLMDEGVLFA